MDNVTLFKKIFSDNDRIADSYHKYLNSGATMPNFWCNKEDLKRFSFEKESLKSMTDLLCVCEPIKPEISRSAYECLKRNENDDHVLLKCEKQVDELKTVFRGVSTKFFEDTKRVDHISRVCSGSLDKYLSNSSANTFAEFHACFVPMFCKDKLKRALDCVNKNNEDLHGCENEIDDMLKCSIDNWTRHVVKVANG